MTQRNHRVKTTRAIHGFCYTLCALMLLVPMHLSADDKKTSTYKATKNVKSPAAELSSRNQSLLAVYSAEVETAADKIISGSPSHAARRQALVWKAEAIPVMQTSLLNTDPITAALDTWAFIFQMKAFMERPALKQTMGDSYPVVAETLRKMEAQMERLVQSAAPNANLADVRQRVRAWAEAHPVQDSLASRESADPDVIKKVGPTKIGTFGAVKELAESMGDLSARLDAYNLYTPKRARWQAQLFLEDLKQDPQVNAALTDLGAVSNAATKLDSQRAAVQTFVRQERIETLDNLQRQRIDTLAALHAERLGVIAGLHAERLGATADLRGEREAVLNGLRDHEVAVMNDIRATSEQELQTFHANSRDLINQLFVRAVELMLLTLALSSLVAWALLRRFYTRPPTERAERGRAFDRAA